MSMLTLKVVMAATSDDMVEIAGKRRGCVVTATAEWLDGWNLKYRVSLVKPFVFCMSPVGWVLPGTGFHMIDKR